MLLAKRRVAPRFEFHDFVGYQRFDGLKQLFLEEFLIKTHSCENRFEIIEHLLHLNTITLIIKSKNVVRFALFCFSKAGSLEQ
jgi:hypothetical protein